MHHKCVTQIPWPRKTEPSEKPLASVGILVMVTKYCRITIYYHWGFGFLDKLS